MPEARGAYARIQALHGMEEFKQLADRLCIVAENKRDLGADRFTLPGFLFAAAPGCGVTTHLQMFAHLLYELDLQRFQGDQRVFEHIFPYKPDAHDVGVGEMLARLSGMAGFHSCFRGVAGLDINGWVDHAHDRALDPLLAFAADYTGRLTLVYEVELLPERNLNPLIARLASETPLEVVRFPTPTAEELAAYLNDFLDRRGCCCDPEAMDFLCRLLAEMRETRMFDGLQTLDNLADEMVYRFMASGRVQNRCIGTDVLDFITRKGGFMDRLRSGKTRSPRRTIGF